MRHLALALLLSGLSLPAAARDITGQVSYRQRIALDPSAELVVEVSGPGGITGESRAASDGRQVPLPFAVSTDDTGAQFLRAAILVGGVAQWVAPPVAVPAGDEALDLGMIALEPFVPLGFASRLRCGETELDLGFAGDMARLRLGGVVHELPLAVSASGARFSDGKDPETMVWTKGNTALVTIAGHELPECRAVALPATLPFIARGNEPGWVLDLTAEGMVLAMQDGDEIRTPLPAAVDGPQGTVLAAEGLTVTLAPRICRDSMTGMPHPQQVTVQAGGAELHGCGGDPATLLAGEWRVTALDGAPLPADAGATLGFDGDGVAGSTGCNRYRAAATLTAEGLTIAPGPLTMMACDPDTMAREQAFIAALTRVTGFDFDDDNGGALVLIAGGDGPVLTAVPAGVPTRP